MKKKYIIAILIPILILIAIIVSINIYNRSVEKGKDYQIEEIKQYHYFILKQHDLFGVIDRQGNTIINPEYSEIKIPNPQKAIFICYQAENTIVLNERKEEILSQYNNVQPIRLKNISSDLMYEKSILKYEKDGKYGLVNFEGKEITKPIYDEIDSFPYKEGELLVKQNGKYGIINIKGNKILEIEYDEIKLDEYYTDENHYRYAGYIVLNKTEEGYRYGYKNSKGKEILNTQYNEISRVTEMQDNDNAYLICAKNGQYGVAKNEETIIENEYQSIHYDATNKLFVVKKSKKYGVVNIEGKVIVPIQYQEIDITGIYIYAKDNQGETKVYNTNGGQENIDANIAILDTMSEKYKIKIINEEGTKYGVIDKTGKQLIEPKYNYIEYLYDNYFIVSSENGKLGILDDKGDIKVETNHDSLQKIQNTGLIQATLAEDKITKIYSKSIEKICEMKDAVIEVKDNYIKVNNELETKYFDKEGKELKNTEIYPNNKLFLKVKDNQYGFVDKSGKLVIEYKYDKAYEFNSYGFATIKKDGKWGAINEQGQEIVPPTYETNEQKELSFIGEYYQVTYGFGEFYYTNANEHE